MFVFLFFFHFSISSAKAEEAPDEIVVTANRLETPESEVASSTTVIGPAEIKRKARAQISELLRGVPGLTLESQGGPGQITSVFIRGTNSDHVLVLIDGVEANDPLNPSRAYDFGNLSTQDVERIEIIRGSQSVLHGSEAIGGVINIITKKGKPGRLQVAATAEYGTYESYRLGGSVRGGQPLGAGTEANGPRLDYALGVSQQGTQGFPAADRNLGNVVNSGESQTTVTGNGEYETGDGARVSAMVRYSNASFDIAGGGGPPGYDVYGDRIGDDPGSKGTDREVIGKLEAVRKLSDVWQAELALHYTDDYRTTYINQVTETLYGQQDIFASHRLRGTFQNNFFLSDFDTLTAGLELASEGGSSTEIYSEGAPDAGLKGVSDRLEAGFVQDQLLSETVFATAGLRYDTYRYVGSQTTYRIAPGLKIPGTETTIKGSVGTGFKVPSLYQRYSSIGDPELRPERSVSYDAGFEQGMGRITLGVTCFLTTFDQLIDYSFATRRYDNVGKASSRGVEAELKARLSESTRARAAYTYTLAKDELTGLPLLHRPKHSLSAELDADVTDRAQLGAQALFVGARADSDPVTFAPVQMGSYYLLFLSARYRITGGLNVFGRVDNLLDRQYEEIDGYGTAGRSVFMGLSEEI